MSAQIEWRVEVSEQAEKQIARLPRPGRERVLRGLERLEKGPYHQNVKPLKARAEWSLRVGGWRALLRVDHQTRVIVVVAIDSRGDIYKG
ncbi:MAG: type II toxin-antitoxin system RelE/ParE family toxin [Bacillota bacterium]